MPEPFIDCFGSRLGARLDFVELERAHDSLSDPDDASPAEIEEALGPGVIGDFGEAALTCARRLLHSKDGTPGELRKILETLRPV